MANADTPFGVRPVKHLNGNPWNGQSMRCYGATSYATALFIGDPVQWAGSACSNGCCPDVQRVATTTSGTVKPWLGGIVGVEPAVATSLVYRAASTARYLQVCADPDMIYEIQDDAGATLAATSVGLNAVFKFTHAGSTITGISGAEMDAGSTTAPAANCTFQMFILGLVDRPDVELAVRGKWLILNSCHSFRTYGLDASPTKATKAVGALGV